MVDSNFLDTISEISSFTNESSMLQSIYGLQKNVILYVNDKRILSKYWLKIKKFIVMIPYTDFVFIELDVLGSINQKKLNFNGDVNIELINYMNNNFKDSIGYYFVAHREGIHFLYRNGEIDRNVESVLETKVKMEKLLQTKFPLEKIEDVFYEFSAYCKSSAAKDFFVSENNKIKASIKEQELRNCLMNYLNKNINGTARQEFCTDSTNDEESVDICISDTKQTAIIEVKFAFSKKFYEGMTFYNYLNRTELGLSQLNRYLNNLHKDKIIVDYAYLYMYVALEENIDQVKMKQEDKLADVRTKFTPIFNSSFKKIITHNLTECINDTDSIVIKL